MSNPIPRNLLKHSAALFPYTGTVNGADQFGTVINLEKVYIESFKQNAMSNLGDMKNDRFVLYFDRVNSLPAGQTFNVKDKLIIDGLICRVRKASPIKPATSNFLHHWELNLA